MTQVTSANGAVMGYENDAQNRLVRAEPGTSNVVQYTYDPAGRRIMKETQDQTAQYVYDGDRVISEYDHAGALQRKYIHGPGLDRPVAMIENTGQAPKTYFYHIDGLGSVIALSGASGDPCQSYEYAIYGQVSAQYPDFTNPYLFTGQRFDRETGLYYYKARYYNPHIGRFMQTDPIGYGDGINWYKYCRNNPGNWVDPGGMDSRAPTFGMGEYVEHPDYGLVTYRPTGRCVILPYNVTPDVVSKFQDKWLRVAHMTGVGEIVVPLAAIGAVCVELAKGAGVGTIVATVAAGVAVEAALLAIHHTAIETSRGDLERIMLGSQGSNFGAYRGFLEIGVYKADDTTALGTGEPLERYWMGVYRLSGPEPFLVDDDQAINDYNSAYASIAKAAAAFSWWISGTGLLSGVSRDRFFYEWYSWGGADISGVKCEIIDLRPPLRPTGGRFRSSHPVIQEPAVGVQ